MIRSHINNQAENLIRFEWKELRPYEQEDLGEPSQAKSSDSTFSLLFSLSESLKAIVALEVSSIIFCFCAHFRRPSTTNLQNKHKHENNLSRLLLFFEAFFASIAFKDAFGQGE